MKSPLVLASNSPRRRELLAAAGFEFQVVAPNITERHDVDLTARELTSLNATRKALAVARRCFGRIVLAADTVVVLDADILGKPQSLGEAAAMLRRLSGRAHEVCSAVFICDPVRRRWTTFQDVSRVDFRRLTDARIRAYIKSVDVLDKAGAYAAQERADEIIERIEGSYTNVIGLPMERTVAALAQFGIRPSEV
ncbi:MAG TPA: Maf family protein [Chthoniobacterales bacterium]|nr:Maf family protein [Chthoniobacterales bacterium]